MPPEGSAPADAAARARLCELWMAYGRHFAKAMRTTFIDHWTPEEYRTLAQSQMRTFGSLGPEMAVADRIAQRMIEWKIPCPPGSVAAPPPPLPGAVTSKARGSNRTLLVAAGAAGAAGVVALAAGGGGSSRTTPSPAPSSQPTPPDVTALHGTYVGRLVTGPGSVASCGRAATAPCNATLGGSANGTPATLTFGGDLANTGVLRPGGALEGLSYQGPANGLGALPAGTVIQWQQQGSVTNAVLRLEGRATVTSAGACNGAVIATTVEATKN
jgi:hypothetical protein